MSKDHVTNEEVHSRIQNAIGVHGEEMETQMYGHISRSSGIAKAFLQETEKRARWRGRHWRRLAGWINVPATRVRSRLGLSFRLAFSSG